MCQTKVTMGGINTQAVLAMRGAGYYSERTAGARDVINDARELVLTALETLSDAGSLRIADFGAADGGTSQQMWSTVIEMLRKSGDTGKLKYSTPTLQVMIFQPCSE